MYLTRHKHLVVFPEELCSIIQKKLLYVTLTAWFFNQFSTTIGTSSRLGDIPGNAVLVFEASGEWNLAGGRELLETASEENKYVCMFLVDGRIIKYRISNKSSFVTGSKWLPDTNQKLPLCECKISQERFCSLFFLASAQQRWAALYSARICFGTIQTKSFWGRHRSPWAGWRA